MSNITDEQIMAHQTPDTIALCYKIGSIEFYSRNSIQIKFIINHVSNWESNAKLLSDWGISGNIYMGSSNDKSPTHICENGADNKANILHISWARAKAIKTLKTYGGIELNNFEKEFINAMYSKGKSVDLDFPAKFAAKWKKSNGK